MAKLKAYIPSISVSLAITILKEYPTTIDGEKAIATKEETAYDFKNLTYTDMTEAQLKEQEEGREDWFEHYRTWSENAEMIELFKIKLDGLKDNKQNKLKRESLADKLIPLKAENKSLARKMKEITDLDPDKFKNMAEDEFDISIGGKDLKELVSVIQNEEFPQITYSSVLGALKDDAKEKKGN